MQSTVNRRRSKKSWRYFNPENINSPGKAELYERVQMLESKIHNAQSQNARYKYIKE